MSGDNFKMVLNRKGEWGQNLPPKLEIADSSNPPAKTQRKRKRHAPQGAEEVQNVVPDPGNSVQGPLEDQAQEEGRHEAQGIQPEDGQAAETAANSEQIAPVSTSHPTGRGKTPIVSGAEMLQYMRERRDLAMKNPIAEESSLPKRRRKIPPVNAQSNPDSNKLGKYFKLAKIGEESRVQTKSTRGQCDEKAYKGPENASDLVETTSKELTTGEKTVPEEATSRTRQRPGTPEAGERS